MGKSKQLAVKLQCQQWRDFFFSAAMVAMDTD